VDGPQQVPPEIDYDLWCGPAAKLPLMRKNLHYDWHWVGTPATATSAIRAFTKWTNAVGPGKSELSPKIITVGGRLGYVDDGETPNTLFTIHDYDDSLLILKCAVCLTSWAGPKEMDGYKAKASAR